MTTSTSNTTLYTAKRSEIGIAPENPRAGLDNDVDDITDLAESIDPAVAGQVLPLICRPGKGKKELKWMALDGSRRLRSFDALIEKGVIDSNHEIKFLLVTTDEEIAAALIAANEHRKEFTPADTLVAVKKMVDRKMSVDKIGRALNMDPKDVQRFSIVANVPDDAIEALRRGRIKMTTLKLLARVKNQDEREQLAAWALNGQLWDHSIHSILNSNSYSMTSMLMFVAGEEDYRARAGAVEQDLLQELPARATDTGLAMTLFTEKVFPLTEHLRAKGINTVVADSSEFDAPADAIAPYIYHAGDEESAIRALNDATSTARNNYVSQSEDLRFEMTEITEVINAQLAHAIANMAPCEVKYAVVYPGNNRFPIGVKFMTSREQYNAWKDTSSTNSNTSSYSTRRYGDGDKIPTRVVKPDMTEENHVFHKHATTIASRALQHSIAQDLRTCSIITVSHMFAQILVEYGDYESNNLVQCKYERRLSEKYEASPNLDDGIVAALRAGKAEFIASGNTVFQYIASLDYEAFNSLFCNLVAFSCDIAEDRTDMVKKRARADAGEVAEFLGHDILNIYSADSELYGKATKKQLLHYAAALDLSEDDLPTKKAALATLIAEKAVEKRWAPPALNFTAPQIEPAKGGDATDSLDDDEEDDIEALSGETEDHEDAETNTFDQDELEDA